LTSLDEQSKIVCAGALVRKIRVREEPKVDATLVAAISAVLEDRVEVAAAYLYGSAAVGRAGLLSDVDVALVPAGGVSAKDRGPLLRELTVALERAYPRAPFDVRFLDELPVSIRGRAVANSRRVLDRDPSARVAAEVRARMDYHDFLFFEREGTREGLRGLREATHHG
jgi:predicted nucleotidyltransferase